MRRDEEMRREMRSKDGGEPQHNMVAVKRALHRLCEICIMYERMRFSRAILLPIIARILTETMENQEL
jgi:hypothetical protein